MRQSTMRTLKSVLDENAPEELTDMVRPTCNKRLPVKDKHTSFAGFQIVHDLVLCRDGSYMLEDSYSGMPICSLQRQVCCGGGRRSLKSWKRLQSQEGRGGLSWAREAFLQLPCGRFLVMRG